MPRKSARIERNVETVGTPSQSISKKLSVKNIILISILVIIALLWKFKGNFIAAMVNGQPISRRQLSDRLVKKFGDQTLDTIINERLILAAARQQGIFVKSEEIDGKIKQIETRLNGKISLDDALKAQGLTKDDFRKELEIQISIEKLFAKDATVSSSEIDDYIVKNSQAFKDSTEPAKMKEDVKALLTQQKINDAFEKWFEDLRKGAKISKFL